MTDMKSKAPWQQHPEVPPTKHLWSEFNWREKRERKVGGGGREGKWMNERLRWCPWSSVPSAKTTCVTAVAAPLDELVCVILLPPGCRRLFVCIVTLGQVWVYSCMCVWECAHRSAAACVEVIYMIMVKLQHFSAVCVGGISNVWGLGGK